VDPTYERDREGGILSSLSISSVLRCYTVPVYEYQCKKCGNVFEREHAIGEKKKYKCPDCSSSRTGKIISPVGVIFKGSGFYATDNRKSNGGSSGKIGTKGTSKPAEEKKSNGSSDSTTETPSDTTQASKN